MRLFLKYLDQELAVNISEDKKLIDLADIAVNNFNLPQGSFDFSLSDSLITDFSQQIQDTEISDNYPHVDVVEKREYTLFKKVRETIPRLKFDDSLNIVVEYYITTHVNDTILEEMLELLALRDSEKNLIRIFASVACAGSDENLCMVLKYLKIGTNFSFSQLVSFIISETGNINKVERLLKYKSIFSDRSDNGMVALMTAVRRWNFDIIKLLVKYGYNINEKQDGETIMFCNPHFYTSDPNERIFWKELVELGADVNAKCILGRTPLIQCCSFPKNNSIEKIQVLIESGAALDAVDSKGNTALDYAIQNEYPDKAKLLIQAGAKCSRALVYAAKHGLHDVMDIILSQPDLNVNLVDECGNTALHYAVRGADVELVENLIELEIDTTTRNNKGVTALGFLLSKERREILDIFVYDIINVVKELMSGDNDE